MSSADQLALLQAQLAALQLKQAEQQSQSQAFQPPINLNPNPAPINPVINPVQPQYTDPQQQLAALQALLQSQAASAPNNTVNSPNTSNTALPNSLLLNSPVHEVKQQQSPLTYQNNYMNNSIDNTKPLINYDNADIEAYKSKGTFKDWFNLSTAVGLFALLILTISLHASIPTA